MAAERDATISIIVPVFNEEAVLPQFYQRMTAALATIPDLSRWEILFVDDGSRDGTAVALTRLAASDARVRVLEFSRNFGHQIALTAGLDHATGDAVVCIDADLQDPPEVVPALVQKWREGFEVVYGARARRAHDSVFKRLSARLFYRLMQRIGNIEIPLDAGDFRLLDRRAVEALRRIGERHRFLRGLTVWIGYRRCGVPYERAERVAGVSKYPLREMVKLAWDAITSFSFAPLRLATYLGFLVSAGSIAVGILVIVARIMLPPESTVLGFPTHGWGSLMVALLFLGGVQLIVLGMIGEYLGRTYDEVKRRPLYIIRRRLGSDG